MKHREELKDLNCLGTALACGCIYLLIAHYGSSSMGSNSYKYPAQFIAGALLASYAGLYFCQWLSGIKDTMPVFTPVTKVLVYLGRHSLDIVIWQFNAFRLIILLQMFLNHDEITWAGVLEHYPYYITAGGWWIVYTFVGLILPILFCNLLRYGIWGRTIKRLHIV